MENDWELNTSTWLKLEMVDREHVALLKCSVCSQFATKLESMRNFKAAFIDGSSNIRLSSVKDHAATDMHAYAMLLLKKQQSSSIVDYAPIAKCFSQSSFDQSTREKSLIYHMIAKEKLAFTKMKSICELEERYGVDLEGGYKNDHACSVFTSFIAREQRKSC